MTKFQLPSAKNLSVAAAVQQFVPTSLYWEILGSNSHDLIIGTRGSGKTMLLRMLSFTHLCAFAHKNQEAKKYIEDRRFGIYLPVGLDWYGGYGQGDGDLDSEMGQASAMNLIACEALIESLVAVLPVLFDEPRRSEVEVEASSSLHGLWFRDSRVCSSFSMLANFLRQEQAMLQDSCLSRDLAEKYETRMSFRKAALLRPVENALGGIRQLLELPSGHRWLFCIDEVENLPPHLRDKLLHILRGTITHFILKLTVQPYVLHENHANVDGAYAVDYRDYEVKRLQYDPRNSEFERIAEGILKNSVDREYGSEVDLPKLVFGSTTFAERAGRTNPAKFSEMKREIDERSPTEGVARRRLPVAAIRLLKQSQEGNSNSIAYSGWRTIIRLSDGNPGFLVRTLNVLLSGRPNFPVPEAHQHRALVQLAHSWVEWADAIYPDGNRLRTLIEDVGRWLMTHLHDTRIGVLDVDFEVGRFRVDLRTLSPEELTAFQMGARHSLFVAYAQGHSSRYPETVGIWRLSYALAPLYWLLPRRGRAIQWTPGGFKDTTSSEYQLSLPIPDVLDDSSGKHN